MPDLLHVGPGPPECGTGRLRRGLRRSQQAVVGVPLRGREGQDGGGKPVGGVGRRGDLALEVVDQGCSWAWLAAVTCACALVASAVRRGIGGRGGVVSDGCDPRGREHEHVDAEVAEDRAEVVRRLLHRGVTLNRLVQLLQRSDVGVEVRHQARWLEPRPLAALTLAIAALRAFTRSVTSVAALALMPGQRRGHRAGATVAG